MKKLALITALCAGFAGYAGATQVCTFEPPASSPGAPVDLMNTTKAICGGLTFEQFELTDAGSGFSRSNALLLSASTIDVAGDLILHLDSSVPAEDLILRFHLTGTSSSAGTSGLSSLANAICSGLVCAADVSVRLETLGPDNSLNLTAYLSSLGSSSSAAAMAQSYAAADVGQVPVVANPEPASLALFIAGLATIVALKRRKRRD
jgi:hypothetical protein